LKISGLTAVATKFLTPNGVNGEPYCGQIKERKAASKERKNE
jgi:hypothetical protein